MNNNEIPCLDKGFVRLVDHMGDDSSIVQAARVSYGPSNKKKSEDNTLIRYLLRNQHTSPFEMVEFKFHCKMPIFIARQWIRHRTASVNEISGRYSEMPNEFYIPEEHNVTFQNPDNKQGGTIEQVTTKNMKSNEKYPIISDEWSWTEQFNDEQQYIRSNYEKYINTGMRKELARINLPLSQYTEWYWKIDLHNLFHFLKLRQDSHAQYEIRVYADAIYKLIEPIVPLSCEAFNDYIRNSIKLSGLEIEFIQNILDKNLWKEFFKENSEIFFTNKRERDECYQKLELLFS